MSKASASAVSSKVQLTMVSLFHAHRGATGVQPQPLVGAKSVQWRDEQFHVEAASVPFHSRHMDVYAPRQGCLLALFGIRDALMELQHWRAVARSSKALFGYLQLQVDVGVPASTAVNRRLLQTQGQALRFINVKRSAADFQKELLKQFATWVHQEGGDAARDMAHVRQMALRPDLFARLLCEDPDLQHIDVMVLPLADKADPGHVRQVALLRAGAQWTELPQGNEQVQMHLPEWMQAPQAAGHRSFSM